MPPWNVRRIALHLKWPAGGSQGDVSVYLPRLVEFGSGSIDGDWHADKNEVTLNNCNIGYNVMQSLIRTRDDLPGWLDNEEDLKNV